MNLNETDILLVEDSPEDVELVSHVLRREHLANNIYVAHDGEEALDFLFCRGAFAARSFDHPPKIVLLDLKLPKVNGLEVLRAIRNDPRTEYVPVVILTSSMEQRDLVDSYKLHVNSYVQKPVDFEKFQIIVQQLGLYWLIVNRPVTATTSVAPEPGKSGD